MTSYASAARRASAIPSISPSVAIVAAAVIVGVIIGVALAIAVPALLADPAAEQARLAAFAEQIRVAIVRDQLWAISHP